MNRRDYRAHAEWAEGIKTARTLAPARPVHHVTRKPAPRKPRRWLLAALFTR